MLTAFKDRFLGQQAFHAGVSWVLSARWWISRILLSTEFPAGARRVEEERELFHCHCDVDA